MTVRDLSQSSVTVRGMGGAQQTPPLPYETANSSIPAGEPETRTGPHNSM